jgi:hypothetical protein
MKTHPLVRFARSRKLREGAAAKALGISHQMWCDMKSGRRWPSATRAREIVERSKGALKLGDLLFWGRSA